MESQYKCLECGLKISDKNYVISRHVKKHSLTLHKYIEKYYLLSEGHFEKCSFCENNAFPTYVICHQNRTYNISYPNGYLCRLLECKNKISLEILGCEYDSKKFESIGSKKEYLSKLHRIEESKAKQMKFNKNRISFDNSLESFIKKYGDIDGKRRHDNRIELISKNSARKNFPCTKENFIIKYGNDLGLKKYTDRCNRISYTSTIDFFIEKYGDIEGNKIWKNKFKLNKTSKASLKIKSILQDMNISYKMEEVISGKRADYFLPDFNIIIEYYGDYWHCNPKVYDSAYYNVRLKMESNEVWKKDDIRIEKIKGNKFSIIIIWESSIISDFILDCAINNVKNKNTIMYI